MTGQRLSRRKLLATIAGGMALALVPGLLLQLGRWLKKLRVIPSIPRKPGGIVVHHSATKPHNQPFEKAKTINADHRKRGFGAWYKGRVYYIAYHYVILPDGTVEKGRPDRCRGGHTRSWRHNHWIGICLVGYFDPKWKNPRYHRPTRAQMESLVRLSRALMEKYRFSSKKILPHRKVNPTQCPGRSFPMGEYMKLVKTGPANRRTPSVSRIKQSGSRRVIKNG